MVNKLYFHEKCSLDVKSIFNNFSRKESKLEFMDALLKLTSDCTNLILAGKDYMSPGFSVER
jgi:hypothetical protein